MLRLKYNQANLVLEVYDHQSRIYSAAMSCPFLIEFVAEIIFMFLWCSPCMISIQPLVGSFIGWFAQHSAKPSYLAMQKLVLLTVFNSKSEGMSSINDNPPYHIQ